MPVGESLFRVFPCPFPFSCCQHLFRSSAFFADSFYWCSFSVFFYLFPLSCFLFFSLLFPFLRSPFLSSPFSALSFSPSCFPSFLFSFSSPFFLSSSLSLVISLNSFSFYFCIVALPSCRFSFLLSLGSDERQKTETTGSKKTETTKRKKKKQRAAKNGNDGQKKRSDRRQKTEETGRKR